MAERVIEQWRPVVGYEGAYEVSDLGRVRSLDREITQTIRGRQCVRRWRGRMLRLCLNSGGYVVVALGAGHYHCAHVLVAAAFLGPRPPGYEVCHANGVRHDNRLANIRYDTRAGNFADMVRHGTRPRGSQKPQAKLTEADIPLIRAATGTQTEIAARFNVDRTIIGDIKRGELWRHV